jgi:hypothetical protein
MAVDASFRTHLVETIWCPKSQRSVSKNLGLLKAPVLAISPAMVASEFLEHNWPNKSLQPTATAVMPPAAQEIMPAVAVAEH